MFNRYDKKHIGKHTTPPAEPIDGYVVYNRDTIKGSLLMYNREVQIEVPINETYSYFYSFKMRDTCLKSIQMFNKDNKPLIMARVAPGDKRMMRLVHEGKLTIFDGRRKFIYKPRDVDRGIMVVCYDNVVDDLGTFLAANTKRDLIMYINDIYGLNINPKTISWQQLLRKIDELD